LATGSYTIDNTEDSITQKAWVPEELGWGAALQDAYARKLDVIGRGFSGTTPLPSHR